MSSNKAKWYVLHTYSGHENKVKVNLEKIVENRGLQEKVLEVAVPMEEQVMHDDKKNKDRVVERKILPGYVLVKMVMDDETWYVARNVKGVTGFVGPGSKPEPLQDGEVERMGIKVYKDVDFKVGETLKVIEGSFKSCVGVVQEINLEKHRVKLNISMFGRETPTELDFSQIEKI